MLEQWIPTIVANYEEFLTSIVDTFIMMGVVGIAALIFGTFFGVILVVTKQGNIMENKVIYFILGKIVDLFRAIPFMILITFLMPATRWIVGTTIGLTGAIFPLIVGTIPFFARQVESALSEVDTGLIEASQAMGCSPVQIIFRVYLRESIPGLIRSVTITLIALIGYIAMVGAVGGGGIGDFCLRFGYTRQQTDATFVCVILLLLITTMVQGIGNYLAKKTTH